MATNVHILENDQKEIYNQNVDHVVQSWEWGQFREKVGSQVIRFGVFVDKRLSGAYQMTVHRVPLTPWKIGFMPRSPVPDPLAIDFLIQQGQKHNMIFIKCEPKVDKKQLTSQQHQLLNQRFHPSARPLFMPHNFIVDLTQSEDQLLANMHHKTRYNIRLAERYGVTVEERSDSEAFEIYLKLFFDTTKRQHYFGHNPLYQRLMWQTLQPAGIAKLLIAFFKGQPLAAWIVLIFHSTLYYAYGGSSDQHKQVMASNLIAWEAMRLGKSLGCANFDMWGALGPLTKPQDPRWGFHRFKAGYGPSLVEYVGSYDLVVHKRLYQVITTADKLRWFFLKLF